MISAPISFDSHVLTEIEANSHTLGCSCKECRCARFARQLLDERTALMNAMPPSRCPLCGSTESKHPCGGVPDVQYRPHQIMSSGGTP